NRPNSHENTKTRNDIDFARSWLLSQRDRDDLNDRLEARGLSAGLRVRVALRHFRLKILDRHARRERHHVFVVLPDVEFMSGWRLEHELALLLQDVPVVRHELEEPRYSHSRRNMSRLYDLKQYCRAERAWLVETIETLVRLESPTTDKAAVDRCGRELVSRLEAIGGRVTRLSRTDRGDHLLAEFGCGESQILLLGHFDTVWPVGQLDRMPLTRSNGTLHGPGVFDMKAGIAIGMLATRALLEADARPSRRIVMLWTTD